ncbi:MAG: hypothetical protein JJU11_02170 [Candidatus Sumerlaeia bacterium]|nr:hypothetical protein [Candidatus Sumerlaeia bacterium]
MARLPLLFVLMLVTTMATAATQWPRPIVPDPEIDTRREMLMRHGINPEPTDLLKFLRTGFRESALPRGLPSEPMLKSTVTNAAIVELGVTGQEAAVPLLIEIVQGKIPSGVERIAMRDFESFPIQELDAQLDRMYQMLIINAIVALGLIGDPTAEEAILDRITRESDTGFALRGSLALGQMGSNKGFPHLYRIARNVEDRNESAEAFRLFFVLTGRNYGVTPNTSIERRRQIVKELGDWYLSQGKTFQVQRSDVMRRMRNPPRAAPIDTSSLRGILRKSRDLADFDGRLAARRHMSRVASDSFDELRSISEDTLEDLDIRRSAMFWLASGDPRGARRPLRRLRNDENQVIAETAQQLLRDIDRDLAQ